MKYKLIKEYPGSPDLGTEIEKDKISKSYFYRCGDKRWVVLNDHAENNPEYWEKVNDNIWWCVWKNDGFFKSWIPYRVEAEKNDSDKNRVWFNTEEEAVEFILFNKPCLSHSDLIWYFNENIEKNRIEVDIDGLLKLIKLRV